MFENIFTVGTQVIILFMLVLIGFVSNKTKMFSPKTIKEVTNFVLYIVTPATIINSYCREFDKQMFTMLLIAIAASFVSFALFIAIAHLIIQDKDKERERVLRFGAVFSNAGFMSLPLQEAILGQIGLFYGAAYVAVFNVVLWTYGSLHMSGDKKNISLKSVFINPGVIGTVIGMTVFVLSIKLPSIIYQPVKYIAALNTPVPMVVLGYHLANSTFNLKGTSVYVSLFLKHIIMPVIMFVGLYILGITGDMLTSLVISVSAPCAAATTMFAEKYNRDTSLAASFVSLSMVLSIITMPIMVGIAMMIK